MNIADMIRLGVKGFKPSDIRSINDSGIETKDIISLAESGYKAADVNELIAFAKEQPVVQPVSQELKPQGPADTPAQGEQKTDYDKQLAEQSAEIAKLKQQLAAAQKANSQQNLGSAEPADPRKEVQNIFKNIY